MHSGRHKDVYRKDKGSVAVLAIMINEEPVVVTRNEVKEYVENPLFLEALTAYNNTKLWGLANGSIGWANEPTDYIDAITALELEARAIEREEIDNVKRESTTKH